MSQLTPDAERLLAELQPKLLRYFAARIPDRMAREDLVGRVNERLLHRLRGPDHVDDLERFAFGVSRHVLHEYWREQKRQATEVSLTTAVENLGVEISTTIETAPHSRKALLRALHECLEGLDGSERLIAERVYGEGKSKENREQLAQELGLSRNTLDARVSRIRRRLEGCVVQKLGAPSA